MKDVLGFNQNIFGYQEFAVGFYFFEEQSGEPMLTIKFVIFDEGENEMTEAKYLIEGLLFLGAGEEFAKFADDAGAFCL